MNAVTKAMVMLAYADTEGWGGVGNDPIYDCAWKSQSARHGGKHVSNDCVRWIAS